MIEEARLQEEKRQAEMKQQYEADLKLA